MALRVRAMAIGAACAALLTQGCASDTCERLCQWFDDVHEERGEAPGEACRETCESDYSQANNYCRYDLRALSRCVEESIADNQGELFEPEEPVDEVTWGDCGEEIDAANESCGCLIAECVGECAQDYALRERTPTCEAINATAPEP